MVFIVNHCYIPTMMCGGKTLILSVLSSLLLCTGAKAIISNPSGNPYQGITERNIFGLKPPPALPGPEENKAPPTKIKLTGITTILGRKQALLLVEVPAKPPQAAREQSYILTEGQRDGEIEVLNIDEKAGTVKVDNRGAIVTLDFVNNGVKLPNAPGSPAPGMAPMPIMNSPVPGVINPGNMPPPPGTRQIPTTRQLRGPGNPAPATPGAGGAAVPGFGAAAGPTGAVSEQQSSLTSEQHSLLIEVQRAKMQEEGDETATIMPPTEFTPGQGDSLFPQ
jgi:hypothetical protein